MLSYKLKHLCSRVIASLSAVGLISITNAGKAHATTYTPGAAVTNTYLDATTFTATYSACLTSDDSEYIATGFAGTNANGRAVCTYILKPGYALVVETGKCIVGAQAVAYYPNKAGTKSICTGANYSGILQNTYSGTTVEGLLTPSDAQVNGHLYSQVQAAYNAGTVSGSQAVVTVPITGDGTALLPSAVGPKEIRIDFDCGEGTFTSGTGVAYVLYKSSFEMPSADNCTPPAGKEFKDWSD